MYSALRQISHRAWQDPYGASPEDPTTAPRIDVNPDPQRYRPLGIHHRAESRGTRSRQDLGGDPSALIFLANHLLKAEGHYITGRKMQRWGPRTKVSVRDPGYCFFSKLDARRPLRCHMTTELSSVILYSRHRERSTVGAWPSFSPRPPWAHVYYNADGR